MRIPFFPHPCQHLLFDIFLMITILIGMRLHLVVLIGIYLMISHAEHLFMYLLPILYVCLLWEKKKFFQVLCPFFNWVAWLFDVNCLNVLYIFDAAAAAKSLQSCPTLQPHRRQPIRLLCPWDSLGKNILAITPLSDILFTYILSHSVLQCIICWQFPSLCKTFRLL